MATTAELIVQGIVTITGGGAAAAGLNAFFSRRTTQAAVTKTQVETGRTHADITNVGAGTADVQVNTSLDLLREMRIDLTAAREDIKSARAEIAALQQWKGHHERLLDAHASWDERVWVVLQERGIKIDPPPPLRADPE